MNLKDIYLAMSGEEGLWLDCPYTYDTIRGYNHGLRGNDSFEGIIYPALPIIKILKQESDKVFIMIAKSLYNGYEDPVIEIVSPKFLEKLMKIETALEAAYPVFVKVYDEENWDGISRKLKNEAREKYKVVPELDSLLVKGYGNEHAPINVYYESPHIAIVEQNLTNNYHFKPYFVQNEKPKSYSNYNTLSHHVIDESENDLPLKDILKDIKVLQLLNDEKYIEGAINRKIEETEIALNELKESKKENSSMLFNEFVVNKGEVLSRRMKLKRKEKSLKEKKNDLVNLSKIFIKKDIIVNKKR